MKSVSLFLLFILCTSSFTFSQTLDNTFTDPLTLRPAKIRCIKVLPDGKSLVGGDITYFKTTRVNNLIRLNIDGTLDETFSFEGKKDLIIQNIEIGSTGDIIVLGQKFESQRDVIWGEFSLYQLGPNGLIKKEVDTFQDVKSISIQSDDKVLVCGGSNTSGYLKRLNSSLSADPSFDNNILFDNQVTCIAINGDNIFAAGIFSNVRGINRKSIVKLKTDGSVDETFNTGTGTNDYIGSLTIQTDGKILIGGSYINKYNGITCHGIARINQDGSLDTGLSLPYFTSPLSDITVSGTDIYLAGRINLNSVIKDYFLRLKSNGSIDDTFQPVLLKEFGFNEFCMSIRGNKIIFNNSAPEKSIYGLSECDNGGNLTSAYSPEVERIGVIRVGDYINKKLVIGGDFIKVNGIMTYGMARLDKNGIVDQSFLQTKNLGSAWQTKIMDNNYLLVTTGKYFFKLDDRAQVKSDFNFQNFKTLYNVTKFRVLDNGKIFASDCNNVYRLNSDGSEDPTFNIGTGVGNVCTSYDFDVQGSKVIFGSEFNSFNGSVVNRLVRLNSDGSIDNTFNIGSGPDDLVSTVKVLKSGEIIIGGDFTHFNSIRVPNKIVKLKQNGAVDLDFINNQNLSGFPSGVYIGGAKLEQIDTLIYIRSYHSIAVLNVNGTIYNNLNLPVTVNLINDIITTKDTTTTGKKKSLGDVKPCLYAFGLFNSDSGNPGSVIKVILGNQSSPTGILDNPDTDVLLFPMPVQNKLSIQYPGIIPETRISIITSGGYSVYSSKISNSLTELDMSSYPPGIYFLRIVSGSNKVITRRIVKK